MSVVLKSKKTINVISLGCSKNLVDSEVLMGQLKANGLNVVFEKNLDKADVTVINTCGFINDAKQESIDTILKAIAAKEKGFTKKVFVMGCLSQRYKKELSEEIQGIDGIFGVNELPEILKLLETNYKKELVGERLLTTPSHFAYLKIAEGCDRHCAFCAIPLIRGRNISRTIEDIVSEARLLANNGVKELILIAQDLTYYGIDIYHKRRLADLLRELIAIEKIEWIRLQYTYPAGFPEDVLEIMKQSPKICKYIDIPLQHISDTILKSMQRNHSQEETRLLIRTIRQKMPSAAIRTTLIVGFPGETKKNFEELKQFVIDSRFDRLGVFTYSPEEGTPAFLLKDSVADKIKQQRMDEIMQIQQEISFDINQQKIGKIFKVLIDRIEDEYFVGRTEFDSPEVDNEVLIPKVEKELTIGAFYDIKITSADNFDLYGTTLI